MRTGSKERRQGAKRGEEGEEERSRVPGWGMGGKTERGRNNKDKEDKNRTMKKGKPRARNKRTSCGSRLWRRGG